MPLRSPKIYSFIFGFQRLVWCPKWTPASSNSFIDIAGKMPPDYITCHTKTRAVQSEICAVRYSRLVELGSNIAEPEAENASGPRGLTLGELEPLAGALLTVLLALMTTRVASQEAEFLEFSAQFRVELHQCTGNPQTGSARLARDTAAACQNHNVKLVQGLGGSQRLPDRGARRLGREVVLKRAIVNLDVALAGTQKYASHRSLPAPGTQILN